MNTLRIILTLLALGSSTVANANATDADLPAVPTHVQAGADAIAPGLFDGSLEVLQY